MEWTGQTLLQISQHLAAHESTSTYHKINVTYSVQNSDMSEDLRISDSILDWLDSTSTDVNSVLMLDGVGGLASPPDQCQLFPARFTSSITHTPPLCVNLNMAYDFSNDDFSLGQNFFGETQSVEVDTDHRGTPASFESLPAHSVESPSYRLPLRPEKLQFLGLDEWDERNSYDEDEPSCLHYTIEWKVLLNNRKISNDTELDLVLKPATYCHLFLKPKLDKLLQRKVSQNGNIRCDDTSVIASVSERGTPKLVKQFENIDIDWSSIEKQFMAWADLFRYGKKLRVSISFSYIDSQPPTGATKLGSKRGSSTTQQMLHDRAAHLDAEEDSTGHPSIW